MTPYHWNFAVVIKYFPALLHGLVGTLELTVVSLAFGMTLGLAIGIMRYSKRRALSWPAAVFVEVFRNVPVLVQLIWFFYALPVLVGVKLSPFVAAVYALSLNTAAFSGEIYRGGIESVGRGQWEAGRAIGMRYFTVMRRIVLPQAIKIMIPPLTNRAIELTKMTALASTIAVAELLYQGELVSSVTYRPLETYTTVALIYLIVIAAGTVLVSRFERHLRRSD